MVLALIDAQSTDEVKAERWTALERVVLSSLSKLTLRFVEAVQLHIKY